MSASPQRLPDAQYHQEAMAVLAAIEARADAWLEDDVVDIDCRRTGGLLELLFPAGSTIVINLQPPLQEIWMAARTGGYHFRRHAQHRWLDTRDGADFYALLSREASAQAGKTLAFTAP